LLDKRKSILYETRTARREGKPRGFPPGRKVDTKKVILVYEGDLSVSSGRGPLRKEVDRYWERCKISLRLKEKMGFGESYRGMAELEKTILTGSFKKGGRGSGKSWKSYRIRKEKRRKE